MLWVSINSIHRKVVYRYDAIITTLYTPPRDLDFLKIGLPKYRYYPQKFFQIFQLFSPSQPKNHTKFYDFLRFFYIITRNALYNFMFFGTILRFFYSLTIIALTTFTIFSVVFWFFTIFLCCNYQRTVKYCYDCSWDIYPFLFLW